MEDITLKFENPIGRRKKRKTKSISKMTRKRKIKSYKRRKRLMGSTTIGKRIVAKKRKKRLGSAKLEVPTKATMGKKRRAYGTVGKKRGRRKLYGSSTMGKKRRATRRGLGRTLGLNLDVKGMFDDILSYGAMGVGGFGGLIATNYISDLIFSEQDSSRPDTKVVSYGDGVLSGLVSFVALTFLQDFVKPSGIVANMFTGAKFTSVLSTMLKLKHILLDGINWKDPNYYLTKDTVVFGDKTNLSTPQDVRIYQSLSGNSSLGTSYYIDDTGETFPLGANRLNTMNGPKMMLGDSSYPSMSASQDVNRAVDSLLQGTNSKQYANIAFR